MIKYMKLNMIKGLIGVSFIVCMSPLGAFYVMQAVDYLNRVAPIVELGEEDYSLLNPGALSLEERVYFSVAHGVIEDVQEMLPRFLEGDPCLDSRLSLVLHQFAGDINLPSDVERFDLSEDEINESQELYRVTLGLFLNYFDRLLVGAGDSNISDLRLIHDLAFYSLYCNMEEYQVAHSWMQSAQQVSEAIQEESYSVTSTSWGE